MTLRTNRITLPGSRMFPKWYVNADGQIDGPFTEGELRDRIADGTLRPTDSVSTDGKSWAAVASVPELARALPPPTVVEQKTEAPPKSGPLVAPKGRKPLADTVVSGSVHRSAVLPDANGPATVPIVSVPGYQIIDTLGAGACGVVYKARQQKLNRVVALKTVLMPDKASDDLIERFKQEAVSLARLQHPNVVAVYDSGLCERPVGQAFFAMELLEGEDLERRVERTGVLDERTAWLVARQTAAALAHAAKFGVVHRDIKPANLFLVPPPTGFPLPPDVPMVKVTDFGLALTRGGPGDSGVRQTADGVVLGTPVYMAPEQCAGSDVDLRADIYALGATVYHVLTGKLPFDGRSFAEVMWKKGRPAPPLEPPVSVETAALVAAMMAVEPDDRPANYAELLERIDALPCLEGGFSYSGLPATSGRVPVVLNPTPSVVEPAPAAPQAASGRKRWLYAIAALAFVGAAVGIAALSGAFNRAPKSKTNGAPPATYVTGDAEPLFDGNVLVWPGTGVSLEKDDDNKPALVINSTATRQFKARGNVRVVIAFDRYRATSAEVVVATSDSARWLVRFDAKEVIFGKLTNGTFEPLGAAVPYPPAKDGQAPYLELRYERAGDKLAAWFDSKPLGQAPAEGAKTTELRIGATGGPVRIESAECVELVEVK